ncbi:ribonuclease III [Candidatus Saccharibacteria bacterium CG10_big_fil_rev_8_21_14_0_10_47_8]|nr:MAG: ribonuclease III [Candidatus Saccharibacteria bacterium CG10_big_fil_rev_8_21_14_0_10_47_8]
MDTSTYKAFAQQHLGGFDNLELLINAFTHRSYLNEHKKTAGQHNERLEFLGDAVLELVVTEYLYNNYSDPEGILTNWRSALVRTESISAAANRNGFEPLLRLSRGEKRGSQRAREQILANCYEAVVGALYLEKGYEATKDFISKTLLPTFDEILKSGSWMDPKSRLQEVVQSKDGFTPVYKVLSEEGPDHDKVFVVGVFVNNTLKGEGNGPSKQAAQVAAAAEALAHYQ